MLLLYLNCRTQSIPNALKSGKQSASGNSKSESSQRSSKVAGQKRKLTALEEIRVVSVYMWVMAAPRPCSH